jgi:hypothetical protein
MKPMKKRVRAWPPNLFVLIFKFLVSRTLYDLQGATNGAEKTTKRVTYGYKLHGIVFRLYKNKFTLKNVWLKAQNRMHGCASH